MSPDRNLLFGILAVQMNFISRDALIVAMNAWVLEKHRPLADILQEQGNLPKDRAELLNALVAEHLKTHDNDPQKSLAALSSVRPIQAALQAVADPDLQHSIGLLRADEPIDLYKTGSRPAHTEPPPGARFRILRPHAKGGLGEVYVAEDTELHREVALKEIQDSHADNSESRGRFVFEAEITGGLEHPNIVPVYGLGTYADGRPYYAMRFIRGDSLQDAIKRFHGKAQGSTSLGFDSLQFRNLLKRFVDVCNAIAYAHSRGILHRDLKPGNIMLGKYGETLVVDWGLAKPVGRAELRKQPDDVDEERVLHPVSGDSFDQTLAGTAIGTPGYMSPEQAEGRLDELGPESDVYSLGATLYVVLTGKAPFNGEFVEVQRKVIAGDFPAPRSVNRQVPAALNAVVLKAMSRRKVDRYVTPTLLAEEIEHYLADEPVAAYREPVAARTKRWARKHPGPVAGLSGSLLVGVVGLIAGAILLSGKNRQLDGANTELRQTNADLDIAKKDSEARRQQAEIARDFARKNYLSALDAFKQMVFGIQDKLENHPGTHQLRRELLGNARAGLQKLLAAAERQGNPDHTLVWSHFRMGELEQLLGNTEAARTEYQVAHDLARTLAEADPTNAIAQSDLSVSYDRRGDVARELGQTKEALDFYRKGLVIRQRLAEADPTNAEAQRDLGISYERLGYVALQFGQTKEALDFYQKTLAIGQRRAEAEPMNAEAQRDLAVSYEKLGDVTRELGQTKEALDFYRKGLVIRQRRVEADPTNAEAQRDLGLSYDRLGDVTLKLGQMKEALDFSQKGLVIRQRRAEADPTNAVAQSDLGLSYDRLGNLARDLGQMKEALDFYRKGLVIRQRRAEADPTNAVAQRDLAVSYEGLGYVALKLGQTKEAREFSQKGLAIILRQVEADPTNDVAQRDLGVYYERLGDVTRELGQTKEALDFYQKGLVIRQRRAEADPTNAVAQRDLGLSYGRLGDVTLKLGQTKEALDLYQKKLVISQHRAAADSMNAEAQRDLIVSYLKLGNLEQEGFEHSSAIDWYEKGIALAKKFERPEFIIPETTVLNQRIAACRNAEKAIADLDFALKQPAAEAPGLLDIRIQYFAKKNELKNLVATAEAYAKPAEMDDELVYNAACGWSLASGLAKDEAKLKEEYAGKALALLRKTPTGKGHLFDSPTNLAAQMKQDKDLDPLRDREDFKKLVAELEKAVPMDGKKSN